MSLISLLDGYTFIPDPRMVVCRQVRFCRSKRRRIRRKWAMRRENHEFSPDESKVYIYEEGRKVIAHPEVLARLKAKLASWRATQHATANSSREAR